MMTPALRRERLGHAVADVVAGARGDARDRLAHEEVGAVVGVACAETKDGTPMINEIIGTAAVRRNFMAS